MTAGHLWSTDGGESIFTESQSIDHLQQQLERGDGDKEEDGEGVGRLQPLLPLILSHSTEAAPAVGNLAVFIVVVVASIVFGLTVIVWFCSVTIRHRRQQNKDCEYGSLVKPNSSASLWSASSPAVPLPLQWKRASNTAAAAAAENSDCCIPFSVPPTAATSISSLQTQSSDSSQQQQQHQHQQQQQQQQHQHQHQQLSRSSLNGSGSTLTSTTTTATTTDESMVNGGARSTGRRAWSLSYDSGERKQECKGGHGGGCVGSGPFSLGSIDPSLYRKTTSDYDDDDDDDEADEGSLGRIRFTVQYNHDSEKLMVTIISARGLQSRTSGTANACDPFVRICLLPDTRSHLQSKFKKKTCNPKFDENFVFQVSVKNLAERVLKLTVYDVDRLRRHNVIGHVLYPLKGHNYETNERSLVSRELELEVPENTLEEKGEVHVALSYNDHTERMSVWIFEGKNFKKYSDSTSNDFYIKVCLMRHSSVVKTKKTDVVKQESDPKFNESFVFKLSADSLDMASLIISAWNSISGQRDKSIGRIVLGSFMFARGKELEHWNEMMASQRGQISHWHVLV